MNHKTANPTNEQPRSKLRGIRKMRCYKNAESCGALNPLVGKIIAIFLIYFITSCHSTTDAPKVKTLSKTSTSWDKKNIPFPRSNEEITTIHITLPPKAKLPFHCHPVPTLAYMISGTIEVEKMNGEKKLFHKGDEIIEVVNS